MIALVAELARDFGVVEQVRRASSTNASRPVQPVVIDVLPKNEFRPAPLLRAHSRGKLRQDTVESREVETKRDFRVRRHCKLDLQQLTHIVAHLREVLLALIAW